MHPLLQSKIFLEQASLHCYSIDFCKGQFYKEQLIVQNISPNIFFFLHIAKLNPKPLMKKAATLYIWGQQWDRIKLVVSAKL